MSMPQSGPPDPHAQGPVSGGPQSPYDPQGAPPPYQQTPSPPQQQAPPPPQQPPSFSAPGGAPAARPAVLTLGGIGAGVLALLFLVRTIVVFFDFNSDYGAGSLEVNILYAGYFLAMAAAAGMATVMAMMGTDFGRIFAVAVAGAAMWDAAGWWKSLIAPLITGHGLEVDNFLWVPAIVSILGGFVGIAVVIMMAMPAIGTYVADKRRKPAAGAPPMGPGPAGPPPAGPAAPQYGGPPPAGQQYDGQPPTDSGQPGQPDQPSTGPQHRSL